MISEGIDEAAVASIADVHSPECFSQRGHHSTVTAQVANSLRECQAFKARPDCQAEPMCQGSSETAQLSQLSQSPLCRRAGEYFLYGFKGALRAGLPVAAGLRTAPRAEGTGPAAAQLPGRTGRCQGRGVSPRAGAAHRLRPSGPQRRRLTHQTQPGRRDQDHTDLRRCPPRKPARKSHPPGAPALSRGRSPSRSYVLAALRALHLDADLPRLDRRLSGGWLRPGRCLRRTSVAPRPGLHQMVIVTPSTRSTAHSRHDFLKREEQIGARTRRFASDELANLGRI